MNYPWALFPQDCGFCILYPIITVCNHATARWLGSSVARQRWKDPESDNIVKHWISLSLNLQASLLAERTSHIETPEWNSKSARSIPRAIHPSTTSMTSKSSHSHADLMTLPNAFRYATPCFHSTQRTLKNSNRFPSAGCTLIFSYHSCRAPR